MPRALLLILPALALIVWGVAAQLPRWTAPQPNWFAVGTPGVCAAVDSLKVYGAQRGEAANGIGSAAAEEAAVQAAIDHYDSLALALSEPLAVQAALPGEAQRAFYVITAQLSDAAAVIYVDAENGDTRALITTPEAETVNCEFDRRTALVAAVRSAPAILLGVYILLTAGVLVARRLLQAKGKRP